ncbi:MAG: hypothetical protein GKS02_04980 [Alphaproteobacteria bacterium]|nr:hypothetical protein [Alphaproteobacteria bacterium]
MLANAYAQVLLFFQNFGVLAALAVILAVGILRIILRLAAAQKQTHTTRAFRDRFQAFCHSSGEDTAAYERLAFLAERMGNTMGRHARVEAKPPFGSQTTKSFVTVLQFIPELRRHFADLQAGGYGLGNDGASWIYHTVDDALIRFLGALDETSKIALRRLINPIAWFREGVERLLALPFIIAGWFGVITTADAVNAEKNSTFRAVAGLTAILAVVTIASTFIVGEKKTADTYRTIGTTAASATNSGMKAVFSAFSDVSKAITAPKPEQ